MMHHKACYIHLTLVFLALSSIMQAKEKHQLYAFEGAYHRGIVLPHHSSIQYFLTEGITGFELNMVFLPQEKDLFDNLYRMPQSGLGFFYSGLGNPSVFGKMYSLHGFLNVPFGMHQSQNRKFRYFYRIAFGASYVTQTWDLNNNYQNTAIGSHINIFVRLSARTYYSLSSNNHVFLDAGLGHVSNGRLQSPNLGLNQFTIGFGLKHQINASETSIFDEVLSPQLKKNLFTIMVAGGAKTKDNFHFKHQPIASFSAGYGRRVSPRRIFGIGMDVFYDETMKGIIINEDEELDKNVEFLRLGIHLSHEVIYKRLNAVMQVGHYVLSPWEEYGMLYTRLGFRYFVSDDIFLNVSLKSHKAIADFIEWGGGYRW